MVVKRVGNLQSFILSRVGREILIKSMVQAILTQTLSCSTAKTCCDKLNLMMAKYIEGGGLRRGKFTGKVGTNCVPQRIMAG